MADIEVHSVDFLKWPFLRDIPHELLKEVVLFKVFNFSEFCFQNEFYCFFVLKNDDVYKLKSSKRDLLKLKELSGKGIICFSGGDSFAIALSHGGRVYSWGKGDNCQLGRGHHDRGDSNIFEEVHNLSDVVRISSGISHTLALTGSGDVYTWGFNAFGECGFSNTYPCEIAVPTKINLPNGVNVSSIACGPTQSFILTTTHKAYAFGCNDSGELGIGNILEEVTSPTLVLLDEPIVKIAVFNYTVLALSTSGHLYIWGIIEYLGLGIEKPNGISAPLRMKNFERVLDIVVPHHQCNSIFFTIVTEDSIYRLGDKNGPTRFDRLQGNKSTNVADIFAGHATPCIKIRRQQADN